MPRPKRWDEIQQLLLPETKQKTVMLHIQYRSEVSQQFLETRTSIPKNFKDRRSTIGIRGSRIEDRGLHGKRSGLMVSAMDSTSRGPVSRPDRDNALCS